MGRFSSLIYMGAMMVVVVAAWVPTAQAATVPCGKAANDDADLTGAWAGLESACPCKRAKAGSWRKDRASFMECARGFADDAVARGAIRPACRNDLVRVARQSTCSRKKGTVTCCKVSKSGAHFCSVTRRAKSCRPNRRRYAEVGTTGVCIDACENVAAPACFVDSECDDGNPCTDDACTAGACENVLDPSCRPGGESGGGSGGTSCTGKGASTHGLSSLEQDLAKLIRNYHKGTMTTCASLSRAAQDHANDMRDRKYYAHKGKNGSEFWERDCKAGYTNGCGPKTWMGEIITGWASTAQGAFQMWKNSPGHNALMKEKNYHVMGIGHACGGPLGHYWVVDFAGANESSCK